MALRRQGLSQRRKAVGFTQESLAEHLGVERSTIVRWEAGDTEPLPSIRPNVARALQVSVDQLAELLTESENADATRALPADTEAAIPVLRPEVAPQVRPSRAELEDLIRPQVAETVEALRRVLRSAGVGLEDLDAMLPAGGASRVPLVPAELDRPGDADPKAAIAPGAAQLPADIAHPAGIDTAGADVGPDTRGSRRFMQFTAAGVLALALALGAAYAPFVASRGGSVPPAAPGTPAPAAPVAALPAPNAVSDHDDSTRSADSTGAVPMAPAAVPNEPAEDPVTSEAAVVPAHRTPTISRSTPRVATTRSPAPRSPAWLIAAAAEASHGRDGVGRLQRLHHPGR